MSSRFDGGSGELVAQPGQPTIFQAPATMPFLTHGIELGYAQSTVTTIHSDIIGTQRLQDPVRVQLDPQVMLVPIQVIKVLPPPTASFYARLADISVEAKNRLFDNRRPLGATKVSEPDFTFVARGHLCANGSIVDLAETGVAYMGALNQDFNTALVLAHELGHVLGLNHNSSVPNVMNPQVTQLTTFVSQDMCAAARAKAAQYVQAKWGVTVNPGQWTVTPPFQR